MNDSTQKPILLVTLAAFGVLTLIAGITDGLPGGVIDAVTFNWWSTQVFVDLVIAAALICVWIYRDARTRGHNPWPWIVGTAIVGMFAPLVYLVLRPIDDSKPVG